MLSSIRTKLTFEYGPLAHGEAVRELQSSEMMIGLADIECDFEEIHDRKMAAVRVREQEPIPCGDAGVNALT